GNGEELPLNPGVFYGLVYLDESLASSTLNLYVDGVLQDSIGIENGVFGGEGALDDKLIATGYDGNSNVVTFSLVSGGETYSSFTAELSDATYEDELPYIEGVHYVVLTFSETADTGNGEELPLNPDVFYGLVYLDESLASSTLNLYVDGVLQDSIGIENGVFGGEGALDDKLIATGYDGNSNVVTFSLVSGGETYSSFTAELSDATYEDELPYIEGVHYVVLTFSEIADTGDTGDSGDTGNINSSEQLPLNPDIFYGMVYLDEALASSTLNLYVDGALQNSIGIENGVFGGEGPLDNKLIATGYDGNSNVVTFSLVSGGETYSSFTAELSDATYEDELPYIEGVHYVVLTFSETADTGDTGDTSDSGSSSGGGGGGSSRSSSSSSSSIISSSDSSETPVTTSVPKTSSSGTSTDSSSNTVESSENVGPDTTQDSPDDTLDYGSDSNETGVVLQQESPLGGINMYLALAAILLILIALAAAWYQSKEKPEVVPQQ
ncbi:surface protein, anchor region, partial [Methanococcus maripaludis]